MESQKNKQKINQYKQQNQTYKYKDQTGGLQKGGEGKLSETDEGE